MEGSSSHQPFQNQHKGLGFGTVKFSDHQGLEMPSFENADASRQDVLNPALKDSMNADENVEGGPVATKDKKYKKPSYPPGDCTNFMRDGWCRFGFNCKYNHPFNRRIQANKEIMNAREENLNRMGQMECKNYIKPEGWKNEKVCRYNHSGQKTVVAPVLGFNFLGLPIRPGEKECPHFTRNGSCKYGLNCWFDHPDPSSMGGGFPHSGYTGLEDTMPPWSLAGPVNEFGPPVDPYMYQPAEFAAYSEWNGYQVPFEHHEAPIHTTSGWSQTMPAAFSMKTAAANAKPFKMNQRRVPAKESPKEDVQPERTSKFGFRFEHPKPSSCPLNDRGLPLRSDTEACAFYCRYGVCKLGPACGFDHPVTLPKSVPASAGSEEADQVPAAGSVEAQVPAGGAVEAQVFQLPDPTNDDN